MTEEVREEMSSKKPKKKKEKKEDTITITKGEYEELLKNKEAQKKLIYAYAEFENFKKRHARDLRQQLDYANEKIVKEILPIIDNLCLAKEHAECNEENREDQFTKFLEGIDLILKQLREVLSRFGVEEIKAIGEKFDPRFHEALDQRESDEHDPGIVMNEYQKGYIYNGRLIRPSKVCICKKKEEKREEKESMDKEGGNK